MLRKQKKQDSDAEDNPIIAAAALIAGFSEPFVALAAVIYTLLQTGRITPQELNILGLDENELERLAAAMAEGTMEGAGMALAVGHAVATYERQIDEIIVSSGKSLSDDERTAFRKTLAQFAKDNGLTDLKVAYRLVCAEQGDPLQRHAPGNYM